MLPEAIWFFFPLLQRGIEGDFSLVGWAVPTNVFLAILSLPLPGRASGQLAYAWRATPSSGTPRYGLP